jgi:uncharacterized protein
MVELGKKTSLPILKRTDFGFYLDGDNMGEILMPKRYITEDMKIGDFVDVFIFLDGEERIVATTETPVAEVGEFGWMKVSKVERVGAFMDWNVSKELLVPFSEQKIKMEEGKSYMIYVYLDPLTERLAGTMKLEKHLDKIFPEYKEVMTQLWTITDVGYKCIIDGKHLGILYKNEVFKKIYPGQKFVSYIKKVREDGKIDLSIEPIGHVRFDINGKTIMDLLHKSGGKLPYNDKTDPEVINRIFGISKKVFKAAIGTLYKQKLIHITENGIVKV